MLRDWLEERRAEADGAYPEPTGPGPIADGPGDAPEELAPTGRGPGARSTRLTGGPPGRPVERDPGAAAADGCWPSCSTGIGARRSRRGGVARPAPEVDRGPDRGERGIGGLDYERDLGPSKKSVVRRYRFPPQDHKFRTGRRAARPGTDRTATGARAPATIVDDRRRARHHRPQARPSRSAIHPTALIPGKPIRRRPDARRAAAGRRRTSSSTGSTATARSAPRAMLLAPAAAPRGTAASRSSGRRDHARRGAPHRDRARRGPSCRSRARPAPGKTYTGARMIVALMRAGKRVGIAAQSHKAISNLLPRSAKPPARPASRRAAMQKCDRGDDAVRPAGRRHRHDNEQVVAALASGDVDVDRGGTAWLFARDDMPEAVDVLFVDEAGQMSLANVVAMSGAASIGDPARRSEPAAAGQPGRPSRRAPGHRPSSTCSAGRPRCDDRRGLFLETTWRMHPAVNDYISRDVLRRSPDAAIRRRRSSASTLRTTGARRRRRPRTSACVHDGQRGDVAPRRPSVVADELVASLLGPAVDERRRPTQPIGVDDILVVAPYNAQVARHRRGGRGAARAGVGHGSARSTSSRARRAPIAIYSMASSSREDRPARHGLPVQPQPAERRDVSGARRGHRRGVARTCSGVACPDARSRCGWPTRSAGSSRWPPTGRRPRAAARAGRPRVEVLDPRARLTAYHPPVTAAVSPRPWTCPPPSWSGCAAGRVWSLVAGVALGSTGHIAAVTVATIVAQDIAGVDGLERRARARRWSWARRSGRSSCLRSWSGRPAGRARRRATRSASLGALVATVAVIVGVAADPARRDGPDRLRQRLEPAVALRRRRPVPGRPPRVGPRHGRLGRHGRRGHRPEPRRRRPATFAESLGLPDAGRRLPRADPVRRASPRS